jgi:hypothetical protein
MANANHEEALSGGASRWNAWRSENPQTEPDLSGTDLSGRNLVRADLSDTNLSNVDLTRANLQHANLIDANLSGTDLTEVEAAHTRWDRARISRSTVLGTLRFHHDHPSLDDGTETLVVPKRDRTLNWGIIRTLGSLPLFGLSYFGLTAAILVILGVDFVNDLELVERDILVPARMTALFWSSLLLAIGSTMYRIACPDRVQEFSETQWVEQHGRPRLLYLAEGFARRAWQWPTTFFLVVGGVLALWLLVDRVVAVLGALY